MIIFVLGIVCILAAVVAGLVSDKRAFGGVLIGIIVIVFATITTVPAQNVGVVTQFGKVTGENFSPGLHFKAPWQKVTDMDGTIQQLNNIGAFPSTGEEADRERGRNTIRLNDNNLMFVDSALRWKINPEAAPSLFKDWGKGGGNVVETKVTSGLVEKELAATLNQELGIYNPLTPGAKGQTNDELSQRVVATLKSRIGDKIIVESYSIIRIDFDDATQARIAKVAQAKADTEVALQEKETATARAAANRELSASVNDPGINTARCLDLIDRGKALPPGFQCFPSSEPVRTQPVG